MGIWLPEEDDLEAESRAVHVITTNVILSEISHSLIILKIMFYYIILLILTKVIQYAVTSATPPIFEHPKNLFR